ncbi:amidohydrolase family protein [Weissella soli]|uniref:amidohydrolase family protein n=1 Tax=Weissella soli TaxID=155866 RepID=UPI003C795A53
MTVIRYTNARVFTGSDSDYDATELVIDDLTGRVLPNDVVSDQTINLSNKYVVPGLINAHTHIVMNPFELTSTTANVVVSTHNALKNLKRSLMAGVTTIRDVGSAFDIDIELAKLEAAGELSAPTILPSGGAISMTGGHGSAMGD